MATIKSYTDLEQSRKLAEILPLESADMYWHSNLNGSDRQYLLDMGEIEYFEIETNFEHYSIRNYDIPAWSLAALFNILPNYEINNFGDGIQLDVNNVALVTEGDETLLDLIVNMIIYLHKLNLL